MTGHSLPAVLLICLTFAGIHSFMASRNGKGILAKCLGVKFMKCYYRLSFVVISAATMFGSFFMIMTLPDVYLFRAPLWLKVTMHLLQATGMIFGMMSLRVLNAAEFFGIRQMLRCHKYKDSDLAMLTIDGLSLVSFIKKGVYSIVRHPIYLAGIVMISLQPDITVNRLLVTVIADSYFIFAAIKEENMMLKFPAMGYAVYQHEVPMFNILKGISAKVHAGKQ